MRILHLAFCAPALLMPAFAQPDMASLVQTSARAFDSYASYQYTEETTTDGGGTGGTTSTTLVRGARGKFRRETKGVLGHDVSLQIFDGESRWTYFLMMKTYTRLQGAWAGTIAPFADRGKAVRSEALEVDGQTHDCWVVEADLSPLHRASTRWYDKVLGIVLRETSYARIERPGGGDPYDNRTATFRHSFQYNLPMDDTLFVFTPPEGATLEIPEGPKPATGMLEKTVYGIEAQAYVPDLRPLTAAVPVAPRNSEAADLQGDVQLLLVIDRTGYVVDAEAITGPQGLQQAALDTAKQWTFRPVIRDGRPVFAYTTGRVSFYRQGPRASARDGELAEQSKATQRRLDLAAQFPRTQEQILADAEQNFSGSDRAAGLPELARDALSAGALEKAVSYSNELLERANNRKQYIRAWDYGDQIYNGNEVLGLVALRQDKLAEARRYLLESAKTPGSPVLGSFGPDLQLAKELVQKGERDTVLEFLEACRSFWKIGGPRLDSLETIVRSGGAI